MAELENTVSQGEQAKGDEDASQTVPRAPAPYAPPSCLDSVWHTDPSFQREERADSISHACQPR